MTFNLREQLGHLRLGIESSETLDEFEVGNENTYVSANEIPAIAETEEIKDSQEEVDDEINNTESMEDLVTAVESHSIKFTKIEELALCLSIAQIRTFKKDIGKGILAKESVSNGNYAILAIESLTDKIKEFKDKFVDLIRKIWEKIAEFFKGIFTRAGRLKKKAESVLKQVTSAPESQGGETFDFTKKGTKICTNAKINFNDLSTSINVITKCVDAEIIGVADAFSKSSDEDLHKNISEAIGDLSVAIEKEFAKAIGEGGKALGFDNNHRDKKSSEVKIVFAYLTDTIRYGTRLHHDIEVPVIDDAQRVIDAIEATTLSKKENIEIVNQVIALLESNADKNYQAATKVFKNTNKFKNMGEDGKDIITFCNMLSHFCISKENIRLMVAEGTLMYVLAGLRESTGKGNTGNSADREAEEKAFEILRKRMKEKDARGVKVALLNLVLDMALQTSSIRNYASLAYKNVPDAFVEYEVTSYSEEINEDKEDWTPKYFHEQNISLESNFCMERIRHLLDVRDYLTKKGIKDFGNPNTK